MDAWNTYLDQLDRNFLSIFFCDWWVEGCVCMCFLFYCLHLASGRQAGGVSDPVQGTYCDHDCWSPGVKSLPLEATRVVSSVPELVQGFSVFATIV